MIVLIFALYFAPTMIAVLRGKRNALAIALVNLVLGWMILPWFFCLVWSVLRDPRFVL